MLAALGADIFQLKFSSRDGNCSRHTAAHDPRLHCHQYFTALHEQTIDGTTSLVLGRHHHHFVRVFRTPELEQLGPGDRSASGILPDQLEFPTPTLTHVPVYCAGSRFAHPCARWFLHMHACMHAGNRPRVDLEFTPLDPDCEYDFVRSILPWCIACMRMHPLF